MKRSHKKHTLTRRTLLQGLGIGGATLAFHQMLPSFARAQSCEEAPPLFFIYCTFEGAWDQLLALDPRDDTAYGVNNEGEIYTGYSLLADNGDQNMNAILQQTGGTGIIQPAGSNINFGPAMGRLAEGDMYKELSVVRGINMGTLTHEVGRRYFLTGKFPRGLSASGNAMGTWVVGQHEGCPPPIPNLVVGVETYNEDQEQYASGLQVSSSLEILTVLLPLGETIPDASNAALDAYLAPLSEPCGRPLLDGNEQVTQYLTNRGYAVDLVTSGLADKFIFNANTNDADMKELFDAFIPGWDGLPAFQFSQQLSGPTGQAILAAQALTQNVSQAVSLQLVSGIDHHDDSYLTDHAPALLGGFNALADLITFLKNKSYDGSSSYWDHTVLMCTSDFSRTPNLNNREGRDHHLASSCLVAGKGIKGNQVIGGTDQGMNFQDIDLATGEVDLSGAGWTVRPPDVYASVLQAAGLDASNIENQNPQVITAMLE